MGQDNNSQSSQSSHNNELDNELMDDLSLDVVKIFTSNKKNFTKNDCKKLLNIIFESLFDEKLKNKNFEFIYSLLNKNGDMYISIEDINPIIKALIVCFDVNYITNSLSFNDKVCIKIGKYLLPTCYYIKKEESSSSD